MINALVNYWRAQSFPVIVYLDDGWACDHFEKCSKMSRTIVQNLLDAGFVPNYEKSIFNPTQILDWLGFTWNLKDGVIEVPRQKIDKIKSNISAILNINYATARNLASVLGKIISLIPSFGNICQLMTRHLCICVCERKSWDSAQIIPLTVRTELEFNR